jgi:hypothetical protein
LIFHGGVGSTLEMRAFSEMPLIKEFLRAGFSNIRIFNETSLEYGIYWGTRNDSMPISARRVGKLKNRVLNKLHSCFVKYI